jgi:hypothetical protein
VKLLDQFTQDLIVTMHRSLGGRRWLIMMPTVLVLGGIFVLLETFILVEYVVDLTSPQSSPNDSTTTFKPHLVPPAKRNKTIKAKNAVKDKKKEQGGKHSKVVAGKTKKEAKLTKESIRTEK